MSTIRRRTSGNVYLPLKLFRKKSRIPSETSSSSSSSSFSDSSCTSSSSSHYFSSSPSSSSSASTSNSTLSSSRCSPSSSSSSIRRAPDRSPDRAPYRAPDRLASDDLELYAQLLIQRHCFVRHGYGWYVFPEFDKEKCQLSTLNYAHVQRVDYSSAASRSSSSASSDEQHVFYKCTCDGFANVAHCHHVDLVKNKNLTRQVANEEGEDEDEDERDVDYIMLVDSLILKRNNRGKKTVHWDISGSGGGGGSGSGSFSSNSRRAKYQMTFSVLFDCYSIPAVVQFTKSLYSLPKIRCRSKGCSSFATKCSHCDAVAKRMAIKYPDIFQEAYLEITEDNAEEQEADEEQEVQPLSTQPIPLPSWLWTEESLNGVEYDTYQRLEHQFEPDSVLYPHHCLHCASPIDLSAYDLSSNDYHVAKLFYQFNSVPVRFVSATLKCGACGQNNKYDGKEDRIFCYSKNLLFAHHLLNEFTLRYTSNANSYQAFCYSIRSNYEMSRCAKCYKSLKRCEDHIKFVDVKTFESAWFSFRDLQDWQFKFQCPFCGPHPKEIIVDGLSLSVEADRCQNVVPPTTTDPLLSEHVHVPGDLNLRYLPNRKLAHLLCRFAGPNRRRHKDKAKPLSAPEMDTMKELLANEEYHPLRELLRLIEWYDSQIKSNNDPANNHEIRQLCARLLRILSSDEPLQQFLRFPDLIKKLFLSFHQNASTTLWNDPVVRNIVTTYCPFIARLLHFFGKYPQYVPHAVKNAIIHAADKASLMQQTNETRRAMPTQVNADQIQEGNYTSTGSFYGCPKIRVRPIYSRDHSIHDKQTTSCHKNFDKSQKMSGGCMFLWCKHRICLGFHIIPTAEGRNDVFSAILTHWPKAPEVIVYDYACQLQEYCLAREPTYFRNTVFLVDRLHVKNHTKCSECFDMGEYHQSGSNKYFNFNDSAAESGNSLLARIRVSCSYMGVARFMRFASVFSEVQNRRRVEVIKKKLKKTGSLVQQRKDMTVEEIESYIQTL